MYVIKEVINHVQITAIPLFLGLLGSFFLSSGMVLQHILPYSPSIGWILGFICFLSASYLAMKNKNHFKIYLQLNFDFGVTFGPQEKRWLYNDSTLLSILKSIHNTIEHTKI